MILVFIFLKKKNQRVVDHSSFHFFFKKSKAFVFCELRGRAAKLCSYCSFESYFSLKKKSGSVWAWRALSANPFFLSQAILPFREPKPASLR